MRVRLPFLWRRGVPKKFKKHSRTLSSPVYFSLLLADTPGRHSPVFDDAYYWPLSFSSYLTLVFYVVHSFYYFCSPSSSSSLFSILSTLVRVVKITQRNYTTAAAASDRLSEHNMNYSRTFNVVSFFFRTLFMYVCVTRTYVSSATVAVRSSVCHSPPPPTLSLTTPAQLPSKSAAIGGWRGDG